MNALDSAREVLALSAASTSKSSSSIASTSTSSVSLVQLWCRALEDASVTSEDKEVVVRALRATKPNEEYASILDSIVPLLLDPLPSLRLETALCVLQAVSTSPVPPVQARLSALVSTVSRALGPLPYQLPSASSTLHRFTSTSLRILNAVVLKIHPLPPDTAAALPALLATWIHHGAGPIGTVTPALDRGRTPASTPLSFGVMSAFAQAAPAVSTRRRQGSTASATSSRASSARRNGPGSDSEEDGSKRYDRRRDAAQIRHDALTCLRSLALSSPRLLHRHWHLFLADSPYLRNRPTLFSLVEHDASLSVRLQACAALDALLEDSAPYLALAEDRSTSSSFTSLSAKLGETVSELHLALSSLLRSPLANGPDREDLHLALLALAAKVARNSPYGRIKRALARQLATAVLPDLASPSQPLVLAAAHALTTIAERYAVTSSSQALDWQELVAAAAPLADEACPEEVQVAGWALLAAAVPVIGPHDCDVSDDELAQALSTVLDSLARDESDEQLRTSAFRIVAAVSRRVRARDKLLDDRTFEAVQVGLDHPAAKVRWNAALATSSLLSLSSSSPRARALLSTLVAAALADSSYKVRIQACSALISAERAGAALPAGEAGRMEEAGRQVRLALEERRVSQREKGHAERLLSLLDELSSRLQLPL
ncbi:hypothetical protein JCM9279_006595 [Rhodotorula babjevae]